MFGFWQGLGWCNPLKEQILATKILGQKFGVVPSISILCFFENPCIIFQHFKKMYLANISPKNQWCQTSEGEYSFDHSEAESHSWAGGSV